MLPVLYQSIMNAYRPAIAPRHQLHNRSELKNLYSRIVKSSQESPRYLLRVDEAKEAYMVNLKESVLFFNAFLSDMDGSEDIPPPFSFQTAYSENPSSADAMVVSPDPSRLPEPFRLTVHGLASAQLNTGIRLPSHRLGIRTGIYRFQAEINGSRYDFQFDITPGSNNQTIITKLADFIGQSGIGIHTSAVTVEGNSYLSLKSELTGSAADLIFSFEDISFPENSEGLVSYLGMNQTDRYPSNASFSIDDTLRSSLRNEFVLNRSLRVQLHAPSEESFLIGFKKDAGKILGTVGTFVEYYNRLLAGDAEYSTCRLLGGSGFVSSKNTVRNVLLREISAVSSLYYGQLESCGLCIGSDKCLAIDESLARQAVLDGSMEQLFTKDSPYRRELSNKLNEIAFNPIQYIDKIIVNYPDLSRNGFRNPYVSSLYSGLLFNTYL